MDSLHSIIAYLAAATSEVGPDIVMPALLVISALGAAGWWATRRQRKGRT